jgi:hypothetical protein
MEWEFVVCGAEEGPALGVELHLEVEVGVHPLGGEGALDNSEYLAGLPDLFQHLSSMLTLFIRMNLLFWWIIASFGLVQISSQI